MTGYLFVYSAWCCKASDLSYWNRLVLTAVFQMNFATKFDELLARAFGSRVVCEPREKCWINTLIGRSFLLNRTRHSFWTVEVRQLGELMQCLCVWCWIDLFLEWLKRPICIVHQLLVFGRRWFSGFKYCGLNQGVVWHWSSSFI